jgi:ATP-dependent protease HslVU (ClpYQ) peptidase subunit
MTVITAIVDGNVCLFSADSGAFCDESVSLRKGSKLFFKTIEGAGQCLLGFAGTFAICQWIKFLSFPTCPEEIETVEKYLVTILQPFLQKSIQRRWKKNSEEARVDVSDYMLLLGIQGCLYTLYSNGDVERAEAHDGMMCFASIGSGAECANSAMFSAQMGSQLKSWEILDVGMKNAEKFTLHVRAPFDVKYV